MVYAPLVEKRGAGFHILSEANDGHGSFSRENVLLKQAGLLATATVMAKILAGVTATVGATVGTGNGVLTMANPATGIDVQDGIYVVKIVNEKANKGEYIVTAPDGEIVGEGEVSVAFTSSHINFTLADGATDFTENTTIPITIDANADLGKWVKLSLTAVDGSEHAAGVLFGPVDTTLADIAGVVDVRACEVLGTELIYPTGATDDQIKAINLALGKLGVIVR